MRRFAELYARLDRAGGTLERRAALVDYFRDAEPADAAWALHVLAGGKLARIATSGELRAWCAEAGGHPLWLVEASHAHVGDLAETLALLLDDPGEATGDLPLHRWIGERLLPLRGADEATRREGIVAAWRALPAAQRLVFNKLLTGALRVGVSARSVQQALAELSGLDIALIAQRMMGGTTPDADWYRGLLAPEGREEDRQLPYPFFLASPLEGAPDALGDIGDWLLEWKWDGIRLQLIRRGAGCALWSRGEERLDGRFPEIEAAAAALPDGTVLDGELLVVDGDRPLPFQRLQPRINRLRPSARLLREAPAALLAYDLLEVDGEDLRAHPLCERRARLEAIVAAAAQPALRVSARVAASSWDEAAALREGARERGVEGLMLKRRASPYRVGRRRGDWWKWKVDPLSIDAVLVYAQSGSGRRATLFTDYSFALWRGDELVPVAKAYSGLDDREILALDRWIRAHTTERFGPVRAVEPVQVFELAFEGVQVSKRHKSGVAVRFPRIARWRQDKPAAEADRLETLEAMLREDA